MIIISLGYYIIIEANVQVWQINQIKLIQINQKKKI